MASTEGPGQWPTRPDEPAPQADRAPGWGDERTVWCEHLDISRRGHHSDIWLPPDAARHFVRALRLAAVTLRRAILRGPNGAAVYLEPGVPVPLPAEFDDLVITLTPVGFIRLAKRLEDEQREIRFPESVVWHVSSGRR